jgi:hypothetical protein
LWTRLAETRRMRAQHPVRQPEQPEKNDLADASLVVGEPFDQLQGALTPELAAEYGAAEDFRGELRHLAEHIDLGRWTEAGPAPAHGLRRIRHDRDELRQARHMDDRCDDASAPAPCGAIVAEQGLKRPAVTRALELEAVVVGAVRELDGFRRIAQEHIAGEHLHRHKAEAVGILLEGGQHIVPTEANALPRRRRLRQPRREWRNEIAQRPTSRPRRAMGAPGACSEVQNYTTAC